MKKLMLIVAVVLTAAATQAASVAWGSLRNGAKDYAGKTVYLVDGGSYDAVIAALATGGADVATVFNSYVLSEATVLATGASTASAAGVGNSIALFVFNDSIADGNTYKTSGIVDVSAYTYEPPAQAQQTYTFNNATFATEGSIGQAVPEPTSGLLLLLGMAGLAFRRKVA